ncbi:MAG TPA: hypothetical protein VHW64_14230 [Nocardioides sp.]|jgi:hypothetical protein|uniref:hypothetical protein n=1 Tax=Nocardioides sp. TaxID=35761 RepID=UPI002E34A7D7|nr:hypothetical protein [Nocardioides sp.]HEX3931859.1 hypothetical protein [Nocardioides sp.]
MVISARQASRIVQDVAGIGPQQSRRALSTGLAGRADRVGGTLLYDEEAVRALAQWHSLDHDALLAACPGGVFVIRLGRGLEPAASASWSERASSIARQPYLGFAAWVQVRARLAGAGRLGCVVTVCGYPVLLADLVSFGARDVGEVPIGLEPPGPWAGLLHQRRLVTSPGPAWLLLGGQPSLGRAGRSRVLGEPVNAGRSTTWSRWT